MKKWMLLLITIFFAANLLVGCTSSDVAKQEEPAEVEVKTETEVDDAVEEVEEYPLTITDAIGNEVTLATKPMKIVSLMPSVTETLFAVGAGDRVIARSDWCNYPEQALELPSVGQMDFDLEILLSLQPDLVLAHEGGLYSAGDKLDQVRDAGIPVVVVPNSESFEGVYEAINLVALVTGNAENGEVIISDLQGAFASVVEKVSKISVDERLTVWIEIDPTLWTTGKGTFMHEILETINVINGAHETEGWGQFNEEDIIVMNPDVIVTTYGYYVENPKQQIMERAGWTSVTAVLKEQIFDVNSDTLSRPGPRLAEGVEELAKLIYPEVFNN